MIEREWRGDIEGLRGLAVLSVVVFHFFPKAAPGGFLGVDIFFVISGFLISGQIFQLLKSNSFSFSEFYSRRIRRIFPALTCTLYFVFLVGWLTLLSDEFHELGKHLLGALGFVSNFVLWNDSGYFAGDSGTKILLHLWSLAIEEQFYIVWPTVCWLGWKFGLKTWKVIGATMATSFVIHLLTINDPIGNFYSPASRVWEILLGAMIAEFSQRKQSEGKVFDLLFKIALVLMGLPIFLYNKDSGLLGLWTVLPCVGAGLVLLTGNNIRLAALLLQNKILRWFGKISYPLYLWHWPLFSFAYILESSFPSRTMRLILVVCAIFMAWATDKFLETPIRTKRSSILPLVFAFLLVGLMGLFAYKMPHLARVGMKFGNLIDSNHSTPECFRKFDFVPSDGTCIEYRSSSPNILLLLGDSHAYSLTPGLINAIESGDTSFGLISLSKGSCPSFVNTENLESPNCRDFINKALDYAQTNSQIKGVILAGRYAAKVSKGNGFGLDSKIYRSYQFSQNGVVSKNNSDAFRQGLIATKNQFKGKNKPILLVLQIPELGFEPHSCVERKLGHSFKLKNCKIERTVVDKRQEEYRGIIFSELKDTNDITLVDPFNIFCNQEYCSAVKNEKILYRDNNHLNTEGAALLGHEVYRTFLRNFERFL